jgi:hypothetical protein
MWTLYSKIPLRRINLKPNWSFKIIKPSLNKKLSFEQITDIERISYQIRDLNLDAMPKNEE